MDWDEYKRNRDITIQKLNAIDLRPLLIKFSGEDIYELMDYILKKYDRDILYCMYNSASFGDYLRDRYGSKFHIRKYEVEEIVFDET